MCGIAGIFDSGSSKSTEALSSHLRKMLNKMHHRGPDDRGEERINKVNGLRLFLGHQRLSVIEPGPGGHQPMSNDDSSIWISTNSEIYNYQDLKSELEIKYKFKSKSDTEVLLRAYENWGIDCLEKLRGMFAFAIWDSQKNQLILARDRLGIKPLYYYSSKNLLIFSSELRAILATNLTNTNINLSGLYQYLSFGRLGSPETLVDNIFEVPPGKFLIADKNGIQIKEFWNPLSNAKKLNREISATKQIGQVLEEAVQLRLVSDVPLGAFLSGGIDSSALVGLMTDSSSKPIITLSVNFKESMYDESEYSTQIANKFGTQHNELNLSEKDLLKELPHALSAMDQPTVDGMNTYIISKAAKEKGLTVALSGLGGDELFAGYDSFNMIPKLTVINKITNALPFIAKKKLGNLIARLMTPSDKTTKLVHLVNGQISGAHVYFLIRALFCEEEISILFSDKSIREAEILKNIDKTQKLIESKKFSSITNLITYLELTQYTAPALLRDTDMMSMAHGLEVRVPFLDHKLVELIFSIPSKFKNNRDYPKALLINSLKKKLPRSIANRKKMGFTLPFENWMRGKMKSEVESVLLTPSQKLSDYISETGIKKIWADYLNKRCSWSRPWSLYVLKNWVEKNI